jgi:hypothetical protein
MGRILTALLATVVLAGCGGAGEGPVTVESHAGKWESGYGTTFYNVVGVLKNEGSQTLAYVKLRVEALDGDETVVASTDTYNESAEALTALGGDLEALQASGKISTFEAGTTQRFRASFLKDEHPTIKSHRVRIVETPTS